MYLSSDCSPATVMKAEINKTKNMQKGSFLND